MDETDSKMNNGPIQSQSNVRNVWKIFSDVDGWMFKKPKYDPCKADVVCGRTKVDPSAEMYDMSHKRRGMAIIFNQIQFKKMPARLGAKIDSDNLARILKRIGFEVQVYIDPSFKTIAMTLQSAAAEDHTDADCLIVVAMSHGESRFLHTTDNIYPVEMLWSAFIGSQCPSLAGKPKLFFIQACRGTQLDDGIQMCHEVDSMSSFSLPSFADIMIAYSSYDGFYSFRNPDTGSWFIQALCQELSQHWRSRDLLRIMTSVVRRVAIDYQSFVPNNEKFHEKKQIPTIVSMLTRLVFFEDKGEEISDDQETTMAAM